MIDLDSIAPCDYCGGRIEWARTDDSVLYHGRCVLCGIEWPDYAEPLTWRDFADLADEVGAGGYHFHAPIAEVERLTRELATATAKGAAEEREAVLEFLREPQEKMDSRAEDADYLRGAADMLRHIILRIERGAHRKEAP